MLFHKGEFCVMTILLNNTCVPAYCISFVLYYMLDWIPNWSCLITCCHKSLPMDIPLKKKTKALKSNYPSYSRNGIINIWRRLHLFKYLPVSLDSLSFSPDKGRTALPSQPSLCPVLYPPGAGPGQQDFPGLHLPRCGWMQGKDCSKEPVF